MPHCVYLGLLDSFTLGPTQPDPPRRRILWPNPTIPDPRMDPTHVQLWSLRSTLFLPDVCLMTSRELTFSFDCGHVAISARQCRADASRSRGCSASPLRISSTDTETSTQRSHSAPSVSCDYNHTILCHRVIWKS